MASYSPRKTTASLARFLAAPFLCEEKVLGPWPHFYPIPCIIPCIFLHEVTQNTITKPFLSDMEMGVVKLKNKQKKPPKTSSSYYYIIKANKYKDSHRAVPRAHVVGVDPRLERQGSAGKTGSSGMD